MSSAGFGPAGPEVGDAPPFAVAGPSQVAMTAERSGSGSFTVSNVTGRPVRARVFVTPAAGADASWFQVLGESERALPEAGTATVEVSLSVPPQVASGPYAFTVGVALEESPDKVVASPTVSFAVPDAVKRRFPWWIVIVAAAAVLVLGLGAAAIWWFNRPGLPRSAARLEPSVLLTGSFVYEGFTFGIDPDTGTARFGAWDVPPDLTIWDLDSYYGQATEPLHVTAYVPGVQTGVVEDGDFMTCRAARLAGLLGDSDIAVADGAETTYVCVVTTDARLAVLEITGRPGESIVRDVAFTVWE